MSRVARSDVAPSPLASPLMLRSLLLASLLLAACGPSDRSDDVPGDDAIAAEAEAEAARDTDGIDIDFSGVRASAELTGNLVDAVTTEGGQLELGVTDEVLFTRLSETFRGEIQSEMEEETADETGLGGTIARAVTGAVAEGLGTAISVPLADVRDVRYENGRIVIEMVDGEPSPFEAAKTNDEPMLSQFSPEAGRRLADAFDKATTR